MLTEKQAIAYCRRKGAPGADRSQLQHESEWHRLAVDLEEDGLELTITIVNDYLAKARENTDFRKTYDTTVYDAFLEALHRDDIKEQILADELIEAIKKDDLGDSIEKEIRTEILQALEEVSDGDASLGDVQDRLEGIRHMVTELTDKYADMINERIEELED